MTYRRMMPDRIWQWWPWVTRRRYETLKLENYTLRDALRDANAELRTCRTVLAGLRAGNVEMTSAFYRAGG